MESSLITAKEALKLANGQRESLEDKILTDLYRNITDNAKHGCTKYMRILPQSVSILKVKAQLEQAGFKVRMSDGNWDPYELLMTIDWSNPL